MLLRKINKNICAMVLAAGFGVSVATGTTLRIASYNIDCADKSSDANITGPAHSLPTVVYAMGLHHIGTNAQPVDILTCEELQTTSLSNFVVQLNYMYGAGTYTYDPTADPNTGGGPDGIIYNPRTVQVISARALRTGQTVLLQSNGTYASAYSPGGGVNGVTRAPMVYQLRPAGYSAAYDFYLYVSHARSTSDDSQGDARYAEAQEIRSDAKYNLPAGSHILYAGDWNLFNGSLENAYKCLTGQAVQAINWADNSPFWANTNQTQAYDPTSKTVPPTTTTWTNGPGDPGTYLYDDATYSGSQFTMSSRLDIQLPNALLFAAYNSQGGVQLAPDTSDPYDTTNFPSSKYPYAFEVFGNNGTTPRGSPVTSSSNHSLDDLTNTVPNASAVYNDIDQSGSGSTLIGSDHYPILGDYKVVPVPVVCPPITLSPTNSTLPLATMGRAYSQVLSAAGGSGPYTFAVISNAPPAGLTLSSDGSLSGTPSAAGTNTFAVMATDTNNCTGSQVYTVVAGAAPTIVAEPQAATNGVGSNILFTVTANGSAPLWYQWQFDGTNLTDSARITGSESSNLSIASLVMSDAGSYQVILTNLFGSTNSGVVSLTVTQSMPQLPPAPPVLSSPASSTNGYFQFNLSSISNTSFAIQASVDLINWSNVGAGVTGTNGLLLFQDTNSPSFPARFYRALWPAP